MKLKCSSKTNPKALSRAIINCLNSNQKVQIKSIGAGAVNQTFKAIHYASVDGNLRLACIPSLEVESPNGQVVSVSTVEVI